MSADWGVFVAALQANVFALDVAGAEKAARNLVDAGADPLGLIETAVRPMAEEIGRRFQCEEYFLPQLMLAGNALEAAMNVLLAAPAAKATPARHTVLIGTVKGDIHTIGKNIVAAMLRGGGFDVHDLGVDVPSKTFVDEAQKRNVEIIALSSLLTTTLPYQREVIEELHQRGVREEFKVLVGGGPATPAWAAEIGADGYGKDAVEALTVARSVLGA